MKARLLSLLTRLDDAAEVALFDLAPRAARHAGLPLLFGAMALLTAGIYREPPQPAAPRAAAVAAPVAAVAPEAGVFLLDRPWCDNPGGGPRQPFTMWYFSDRPLKDRGLWSIFHHGVPAKASYEIWLLRPSDRALTLTSAFDKRTVKLPYRITREKRGRADLKLTIEHDPHHGGQSHDYWSRVDKWRGHDDVPLAAALLNLD